MKLFIIIFIALLVTYICYRRFSGRGRHMPLDQLSKEELREDDNILEDLNFEIQKIESEIEEQNQLILEEHNQRILEEYRQYNTLIEDINEKLKNNIIGQRKDVTELKLDQIVYEGKAESLKLPEDPIEREKMLKKYIK